MTSNRFIFVGFELNTELDEALKSCLEKDRIYLEDPNYLEKVSQDGIQYIGKRIKDTAPLDRIEDTARSVVSLLMKLQSSWKAKTLDVKLVAMEEISEII